MIKNSNATARVSLSTPKNAISVSEGDQYITVSELVMLLRERGIKISRPGADDYNTLRYYTKIGLLPHMVRRFSVHENSVVGHYPVSVVDDLKIITDCKNDGLNNQQIKKLLLMSRGNSTRKKKEKSPDYVFRFGLAGLVLLAVLSIGVIGVGLSPNWSNKMQANLNRANDSFSQNLLSRISPDLARYFGMHLGESSINSEVNVDYANNFKSDSTNVLGWKDLISMSTKYSDDQITKSLTNFIYLGKNIELTADGDIQLLGNLKSSLLETNTLKVEKGVSIRDEFNSQYYCVHIVDGVLLTDQGECKY